MARPGPASSKGSSRRWSAARPRTRSTSGEHWRIWASTPARPRSKPCSSAVNRPWGSNPRASGSRICGRLGWLSSMAAPRPRLTPAAIAAGRPSVPTDRWRPISWRTCRSGNWWTTISGSRSSPASAVSRCVPISTRKARHSFASWWATTPSMTTTDARAGGPTCARSDPSLGARTT